MLAGEALRLETGSETECNDAHGNVVEHYLLDAGKIVGE